MYFDGDGAYVWERHRLPDDWQERLLAHVPDGPTAPIVAAMQGIVARHGELSIILWQVQELALSVCGVDRPRFHAAYAAVAERLMTLGGSAWPLTVALHDHDHANDPVTQLTTRFLSCDGEWRALLRLADAGWLPVEYQRGSGFDWVVSKDGVKMQVEVKTKLPLGSAAGRLTRSFIGFGMLPRFEFLREVDFSWYVTDDTNDSTVQIFIESFLAYSLTIAQHSHEGRPAMITLTERKKGELVELRVRLGVRAQRSLWLELTNENRRAVFDTSPAQFNDKVFTGSGSFKSSHGVDADLPFIAESFKKLLREQRRDDDTLLLFVWHMPARAFSYPPQRIAAFWRSWCEENGIVRGALLPVTPNGNLQPLLLSDSAARLDLGTAGA